MYYTNITNKELIAFHNILAHNFNIKLTDVLTSNLFKVETIIQNSIYRIYPLFYTHTISSSNSNDKILENKCIICNKQDKETYLTFISDENEEINDYSEYGTYYDISDILSINQFNAFVSLLRQNTQHKDTFQLKQGTINGSYGDYTFNLESTTIVDTGILITNETLLNIGTVKLQNPIFNSSNYVLKLKVYHIADVNVCDIHDDNIVVEELEIELETDVDVIIPFNSLNYHYVIGFDAIVEINHTNPIIQYFPQHVKLNADKEIIQSNEVLDLVATVSDDVKRLNNQTVYFYEEYEPFTVSLSADKNIIQTSEILDLTAKLKDEDGSLIEDEEIYFYEIIE